MFNLLGYQINQEMKHYSISKSVEVKGKTIPKGNYSGDGVISVKFSEIFSKECYQQLLKTKKGNFLSF